MKRPSGRIASTLAGTLLCVSVGMALTPVEAAYKLIKEQEENFVVPTSEKTVLVGSYKGDGKFYGERTKLERVRVSILDLITFYRYEVLTPTIDVDAVYANLEWHFPGLSGTYKVTVVTEDGTRTRLTSEEKRFSIGGAKGQLMTFRTNNFGKIKWVLEDPSMSDPLKRFTVDSLILRRPKRIIGAGAFTMPVLPVVLLYEPSPDVKNNNYAQYTEARSVGVTQSIGFSYAMSTTKPVSCEFSDMDELKTVMSLGAEAGKASGDPYLMGVGKALDIIASGIGSASASQTTGEVIGGRQVMRLADVAQFDVSTGERGENGGGPGRGDVFYFLRNVRFVWYAAYDNQGPGSASLAVLGWDHRTVADVSELVHDPFPEVQSMIRLDPFYPPASELLGPRSQETAWERLGVQLVKSRGMQRLVWIDNYEPIGKPDLAYAAAHSVTKEDMRFSETFTSTLEDVKEGWLGFLGVGPSETKTVQTDTRLSQSQNVAVTETKTAAIWVFSKPGEHKQYDIYYDRLFGTFAALQSGPSLPRAIVAGDLRDAKGRLLPYTQVRLQAGGRSFATFTDSMGRYEYHSADIPPGKAKLLAGRITKWINVTSVKASAPAAVPTKSPAD
ncbi:MAG: hypothetical protein JXA57_20705 [Armatimonadetes bacterium]|nr:hypothetical protein [Armatimonadota bacterium]